MEYTTLGLPKPGASDGGRGVKQTTFISQFSAAMEDADDSIHSLVGHGNFYASDYGTDQAAIQAAINAIGSDYRVLVLTPANWSITTNMSVPANIVLRVENGALLYLGAGVAFTVAYIDAGSYQIFVCGTGSVSITGQFEAKSSWFGQSVSGLQKAIDAVQSTTKRLVIDQAITFSGSGDYLVRISSYMKIRSKWMLVHSVSAGTTASCIFSLRSSAAMMPFVLFEDFFLYAGVGAAYNGNLVQFEIGSTYRINLSMFKRCQILNDYTLTTGWAIYAKNDVGSPDISGLARLTFDHCYVSGGISGTTETWGDEVVFNKLYIYGPRAIDMSFTDGASQFGLIHSTVVCAGGAIIRNANAPNIFQSWFEFSGTYTGGQSGYLSLLGPVSLPKINYNTFNCRNASIGYDIHIDDAYRCLVDANHFYASDGTKAINITANADQTTITESNVFFGTTTIDDAGNGTRGIWKPITLLNSWVEYSGSYPARYNIDREGNVRVEGRIKSGTLTTNIEVFRFGVGARPEYLLKKALVAVNGAAYDSYIIRIDPNGYAYIALTWASNEAVELSGIYFKALQIV